MHQNLAGVSKCITEGEKRKLCLFHWALDVVSPFSAQKHLSFTLGVMGVQYIAHYVSETDKIELFPDFSVGLKVRELGEKGIHIQMLPLPLVLHNFPVCPVQCQTVFSLTPLLE